MMEALLAPKAAFINAVDAIAGRAPTDVNGGTIEAVDATANDGGAIAAVTIDAAVTPSAIEAPLPLQKLDGGSMMTVGMV